MDYRLYTSLTAIVDAGGNRYSICLNNFGCDGEKSIYFGYKTDKNGFRKEGT